LDQLAKDKRAAAAEDRVNGEASRKRPRMDDGDEPFFKGESFPSAQVETHLTIFMTSSYSSGFTIFKYKATGRGDPFSPWWSF